MSTQFLRGAGNLGSCAMCPALSVSILALEMSIKTRLRSRDT